MISIFWSLLYSIATNEIFVKIFHMNGHDLNFTFFPHSNLPVLNVAFMNEHGNKFFAHYNLLWKQ